MTALQVRDFPDQMYEELKRRAAENHRSVAQQTIAYVEEGMAAERMRKERQRTRERAAEATQAQDALADIPIPANVRAASARARTIHWGSDAVSAWRVESDAEVQARIEKRRRLFEAIEKHPLKLPDDIDIAEMIRKGREDRTNRILEASGLGAAADDDKAKASA